MNTPEWTRPDGDDFSPEIGAIAEGQDAATLVWPQQALDLAEVMERLIQALDHETDLIHAHRNNDIAETTSDKQALAAAFGRALVAMADIDLDAEIRDSLMQLDTRLRDALQANENALGGGLQSFDRILKRAAFHAKPQRQAPIGYGPSGARPKPSDGPGLSLLNGLKL
jgi:hypothetical protein